MIKEDYVSFEVAKLLKAKNFPQSLDGISAMYDSEGNFASFCTTGRFYLFPDDFGEADFVAPTPQMASEWLRQKHNIHITTEWYYKNTPEETNDMSVVYISYIDSPTNPNIDFETSAHTEPQEAICEALCIALNEI